jgi:exonuclease SbcC
LNFLRRESPEKENITNRINGFEDELKTLTREIENRSIKAKIDLESLSEIYEKQKGELRQARIKLIELERRVAAAKATLKHKKARIKELKDNITVLEVKLKEKKTLRTYKSLLEDIRWVFHKDVLQKELRKRAKPLIEEYTREVFLTFNLPYSDVTLTDDYSIEVHGAEGVERVDMLSAGERIAAALALRVGLSRALSGQRLELLILDEPTIHLDVQRRRELVDIVRNLSLIPQTIVVTHDKEFEEAADRVIEVEKIKGVSIVR